MLHLVTGYKGSPHITSADQGAFNAALIGLGDYVCKTGRQFEAQIMSNNSVRIHDGDLLMQGRHVNLKVDTYENLEIENGTQGMKRNDLIVCRYAKDATSGQEAALLVVLKGTPTSGTASDPVVTTGDILGGDILHEMPLYRVKIEGLSIVAIQKLFNTVSPVVDVVTDEDLKQHTSNKNNPHGVTAKQVGAMPLYTTLAQLGLSSGTTTVEICKALPEYSRLVLEASTTLVTDIPFSNGNIEMVRLSSSRLMARFEVTGTMIPKTWFGCWHVQSGWSGWLRIYDEGNKPTASDVGAVPTSRTVNGKPLSANIILSAADVGAIDASEKPSGYYTGNGATSRTIATGGLGTIIIFGDFMKAELPVFAVMNDKYIGLWEGVEDAESDQVAQFIAEELNGEGFKNGVLTIGDYLDKWLNVSGEGYYYFVV